jgi:hypothetical protein
MWKDKLSLAIVAAVVLLALIGAAQASAALWPIIGGDTAARSAATTPAATAPASAGAASPSALATPQPPVVVASAPAVVAVRIDVGGDGYSDAATGAVWEADRPYTAGRWGYIGHKSMQVVSTSRPVAGSSASLVYQSQRLGQHSYRFDIPNGTYRVTLNLAELQPTMQPGGRSFDVVAQGALVLRDVDIRRDSAIYRAYDRAFTAIVSKGSLFIEFAPRSGQVSIAGIEVVSLAALALPTQQPAATTPPAAPALSPTPPATSMIKAVLSPTAPASATTIVSATAAPPATATAGAAPSATAMPPATATATATATAVPPTAASTPTPAPSSTATLAPTASPTTPPATETPAPTPTVPTATPATPATPAAPAETATPTTTPAPEPGVLRQDSFSVRFTGSDETGARAVLEAMVALRPRLAEETGLNTGPVEVKLFASRDEYNQAVGITVPADQVGNVVDAGRIWLLDPGKTPANERGDILKGVQVSLAKATLMQIPGLPLWFTEGIASYEARLWNDYRDAYMRSLVAMRRLASLRALDGWAYNYLGGAVTAHTVITYLVNAYGAQALPALVGAMATQDFDEAVSSTLGVTYAEFDRSWLMYLQATFGR